MTDETKSEACEHTCPHDCEALNKLLLREAAIEALYLRLVQSCDYPNVKEFTAALLEERRKHLRIFEGSVNRLYSSFDPAGV